ncbi:hypothetical protein [Muricoccus radiodurans]|uniref:hypothetical protein n=1 Tax=Muricoccus radiodurans TaxID=2231721 RepID=UPI003CEEC46B
MRSLSALIATLAGLVPAVATAQTDLVDRVRACAAISSAVQRLDCFDNAARGVASASRPATDRLPGFGDLPATAGPPARNAPIVLTRQDMTFRTRLREAATRPPNFAGHYVLTTWGCGSGCLMGAVVNALDGRVTFLPATICCLPFDVEGVEPISFRADSRLLILNGVRDEAEGDLGAHYYRIEGARFVHLRDAPLPQGR